MLPIEPKVKRKRSETKAAAAETDVQLVAWTILMAHTVLESEPGNL